MGNETPFQRPSALSQLRSQPITNFPD
jgi:hypothetical protein